MKYQTYEPCHCYTHATIWYDGKLIAVSSGSCMHLILMLYMHFEEFLVYSKVFVDVCVVYDPCIPNKLVEQMCVQTMQNSPLNCIYRTRNMHLCLIYFWIVVLANPKIYTLGIHSYSIVAKVVVLMQNVNNRACSLLLLWVHLQCIFEFGKSLCFSFS